MVPLAVSRRMRSAAGLNLTGRGHDIPTRAVSGDTLTKPGLQHSGAIETCVPDGHRQGPMFCILSCAPMSLVGVFH